jgi:hypothetical protein
MRHRLQGGGVLQGPSCLVSHGTVRRTVDGVQVGEIPVADLLP